MTPRTDYAREVRNALMDAGKLCAGLGIAQGAKPQAGGLVIRCPVHGEKNPSCSVITRRDGTLSVRCFACDFSGDALTLIAHVRGLRLNDRDDFRQVLAEGAELAGHLVLAAEILDGQPRPERQRIVAPPPGEERDYPAAEELRDLWQRGTRPDEDRECSGYLVRRRLDPTIVTERGLARVLPATDLPEWAQYGKRSWNETGHRLFVLAFNADGVVRGVRAIQVRHSEPPKRLPPKGRKAAELVCANRAGRKMLQGSAPRRVVVVEGEPDFLSHAMVQDERVAVLGVFSGSWTNRFGAAIPRGAHVQVRTHVDEQGERYATKIIESIGEKAECWRATG